VRLSVVKEEHRVVEGKQGVIKNRLITLTQRLVSPRGLIEAVGVGIEEVILFVMTPQTAVEVKQVFIKREESAEIEVTLI